MLVQQLTKSPPDIQFPTFSRQPVISSHTLFMIRTLTRLPESVVLFGMPMSPLKMFKYGTQFGYRFTVNSTLVLPLPRSCLLPRQVKSGLLDGAIQQFSHKMPLLDLSSNLQVWTVSGSTLLNRTSLNNRQGFLLVKSAWFSTLYETFRPRSLLSRWLFSFHFTTFLLNLTFEVFPYTHLFSPFNTLLRSTLHRHHDYLLMS